LSIEEAQNQANENLASQERSVAQLRADLELSSYTSGEGNKVKAKSAQRPKLSDIEPSSDEAEVPAQKPKKTEEPPADPTIGVPEIVADFQESIVISEEDTPLVISEEEATAKPVPSTSTSAAPPVPSWMTVPAPVPLVDIHIPLRKPCRPSKPHNPIGKLKAELSSPEPVPRAPEIKQHARKRTKKVTSMHLAKASLNFRRRSGEIADDFGITYQLTPDEKYQIQRELTKMRLAQKILALRMRAQFPVACKSEHSRQGFLEYFANTTKRITSHQSRPRDHSGVVTRFKSLVAIPPNNDPNPFIHTTLYP